MRRHVGEIEIAAFSAAGHKRLRAQVKGDTPELIETLGCIPEVAQLSPTSSTFFLATAASTVRRVAEHIAWRQFWTGGRSGKAGCMDLDHLRLSSFLALAACLHRSPAALIRATDPRSMSCTGSRSIAASPPGFWRARLERHDGRVPGCCLAAEPSSRGIEKSNKGQEIVRS